MCSDFAHKAVPKPALQATRTNCQLLLLVHDCKSTMVTRNETILNVRGRAVGGTCRRLNGAGLQNPNTPGLNSCASNNVELTAVQATSEGRRSQEKGLT